MKCSIRFAPSSIALLVLEQEFKSWEYFKNKYPILFMNEEFHV